ncbi:hypothetical protein Leryth_021698 [Lithospermum erythrorhizon]|nr:hypothetical protein Leryth_021698 [Lithospermum erythrorhizon]
MPQDPGIKNTKYKEQIKKTRPGPALEAVKARAMRVLKQKRMLLVEGNPFILATHLFSHPLPLAESSMGLYNRWYQ